MQLSLQSIATFVMALAVAPLPATAQLGPFSATYDFSAVSTSSGTIDPTPPPTVVGLTLGSFAAVGVSANPGAAGRFTFSGWNNTTPGLDQNRFYEVTLAPSPGNLLNLDSISFGVRRSGTGPRDFSIRSSMDDFASTLGEATATSPEISVTDNTFRFINDSSPSANITGNKIDLSSAYDTLTQPVSFRFYAANPESASGSFTVDEVTFAGVSAVPEPHEYAALSAGALVAFAIARKRCRQATPVTAIQNISQAPL
jgi:hypothetical protein